MCFQPLHLLQTQISLYLHCTFVRIVNRYLTVLLVSCLYLLYLLYFLICYFAVLESSPELIPFSYHASSCSSGLRFWPSCILTSWQFSGATVMSSVQCGSLGIYLIIFILKPELLILLRWATEIGYYFYHIYCHHDLPLPTVSSPSGIKLLIFVLCLAVPLPVLCRSHCRSEG